MSHKDQYIDALKAMHDAIKLKEVVKNLREDAAHSGETIQHHDKKHGEEFIGTFSKEMGKANGASQTKDFWEFILQKEEKKQPAAPTPKTTGTVSGIAHGPQGDLLDDDTIILANAQTKNPIMVNGMVLSARLAGSKFAFTNVPFDTPMLLFSNRYGLGAINNDRKYVLCTQDRPDEQGEFIFEYGKEAKVDILLRDGATYPVGEDVPFRSGREYHGGGGKNPKLELVVAKGGKTLVNGQEYYKLPNEDTIVFAELGDYTLQLVGNDEGQSVVSNAVTIHIIPGREQEHTIQFTDPLGMPDSFELRVGTKPLTVEKGVGKIVVPTGTYEITDPSGVYETMHVPLVHKDFPNELVLTRKKILLAAHVTDLSGKKKFKQAKISVLANVHGQSKQIARGEADDEGVARFELFANLHCSLVIDVTRTDSNYNIVIVDMTLLAENSTVTIKLPRNDEQASGAKPVIEKSGVVTGGVSGQKKNTVSTDALAVSVKPANVVEPVKKGSIWHGLLPTEFRGVTTVSFDVNRVGIAANSYYMYRLAFLEHGDFEGKVRFLKDLRPLGIMVTGIKSGKDTSDRPIKVDTLEHADEHFTVLESEPVRSAQETRTINIMFGANKELESIDGFSLLGAGVHALQVVLDVALVRVKQGAAELILDANGKPVLSQAIVTVQRPHDQLSFDL